MTDTASAAPSADEILTLWHRQPIQVNQSADAFVVAFAREALAKWGQPTHSEPVVCGCGDEYPPQGCDAGFIAAIGRCANCQAALDCAQPQAEPKSGARSFQTYGEVNAYSKGYYAGKKAATQAQAGAVPLTCEWTHNADDSFWDTECGQSWRFDDGGPKENRMNFCHCCGKTLRIKGGQHG